MSSRFPSNSALPSAPPDVAASFLASLIFRLGLGFDLPDLSGFSLPRRRLMDHRVSPVIASSGSAVPASSGCPESCIYGWVDDVSRSSRTLHPPLSPRMNLRSNRAMHIQFPDSGCILSISLMLLACRRTGPQTADFNCILHRPVRKELRLQFPTGSSTPFTLR